MINSDKRIVVGQIVGFHGLKGWVKVFSYTQPREKVFEYSPWQFSRAGVWDEVPVIETAGSGKTLIARLRGIDSRELAAPWVGLDIAVSRSLMPPSTHGAWYWVDLEGLQVINDDGVPLGHVDHLLETGVTTLLW